MKMTKMQQFLPSQFAYLPDIKGKYGFTLIENAPTLPPPLIYRETV